MWYQGTAQRLVAGRTRLAIRGEDWRGAIAWVKKQKGRNESVWLDSGLIEARIFAQPYHADLAPSQLQWQYFTFPVRGPYALPGTVVASPTAQWGANRDNISGGRLPSAGDAEGRKRLWMISRSRRSVVEHWCHSIGGWAQDVEIRSFGRIHVARLDPGTADERIDEAENGK